MTSNAASPSSTSTQRSRRAALLRLAAPAAALALPALGLRLAHANTPLRVTPSQMEGPFYPVVRSW